MVDQAEGPDLSDVVADVNDIEAELEELAASNGLGPAEEFVTALEEQGMTAEEVDAEVAAGR